MASVKILKMGEEEILPQTSANAVFTLDGGTVEAKLEENKNVAITAQTIANAAIPKNNFSLSGTTLNITL